MRRNWVLTVAVLVALGGLIRGLTAGALWDPHEVAFAELARRLALNLLGGGDLGVPGADNSVPIRADLGRGELPFTLAALGFRWGGLAPWAGRLPLTLGALAGLGAVYTVLARMGERPEAERRLPLYGVLVLSTTPLYFLQARSLLGDAVTLACFAMAWSGLALACLSSSATTQARCGFAALGAVGLYAGFWCRGAIVSVALPSLAVGLPSLLLRRASPWGRWGGLVTTLLGVLALALGAQALALSARSGEYSVFVGSRVQTAVALTTFDVPFGQLAHALFPWSAAVPAVLWLVAQPAGEADSEHVALLQSAALAVGLGLCSQAWLAPQLGHFALPSVACFAVLVAVALARLERAPRSLPLLGSMVAASALVIGYDLHQNPDKTLSGFALPGEALPDSLRGSASALWLGAGALIALVATLWLYERGDAGRPRFQRAEYSAVLSSFQRAWDGNLLFAALLLETMLVGFLVLAALSERLVALPQLEGFGSFWRKLVAALAIALPLVPLAPLAAMVLRDVMRLLPRRAPALLLALAVVGTTASLGLYPALAAQLSPKEAFERYRALRGDGELLGVLGAHSGAARFQGAPSAQAFDGVDAAIAWLTEDYPRQRRWLVLKSGDLPELNARFRELTQRNLPILDARSSEVLLASNRLEPGEQDESPLAPLVLSAPPALEHPLRAVLDHKLEVLGWRLVARDGAPQNSLRPGESYRFVVYYRVLAPLTGSWQVFVHLDGLQRRFNADHEPLAGRYPLRLWRPGDVIADAAELELEPNFSPGAYQVFFGLFSGERRLPVTEGAAVEGRIQAGTLQVR